VETQTHSSEPTRATDPTVGVYVHIPFCERVCPYCSFAVVAAPEIELELEERYVAALLTELDSRREAFAGRSLASLYLGGGTPSRLTPDSIARIVDGVRAAFERIETVEVTLEINPSTLERIRLPRFREAGVTRASVGVQSFDDGVLHRLGRAHGAEEVHLTLAACREAGFPAISLDLIFAAPGQDLDGFERDLDRTLAFGPQHVSLYELTIEAGTPYELAARRGQLPLAGEDEAIAMMDMAEARLRAANFDHYETSNYARPGYAAVHNRRYWERRPVLGLGVGAFSTDPAGPAAPFGSRRANVRDLHTYLNRVQQRQPPLAGPTEIFDAQTARGEAAFLALRRSAGLSARDFEAEFGGSPRSFYGPTIDRLLEAGLLEERDAGDLRLSPRGRLLADTVSAEFV
jgi:oxygen-independent coproporphyrinogen-3 oxidase